MSELNKGRSATIEKEEFSAQDAEKVVKGALGDDAFEKEDELGSSDTAKKEYADYEDARKLPENLRSLWWRIDNERAQIMEQADKSSKKNTAKLTAEKLDAVNNELDDLARQSDNLSEIQGIIVGEKDPDKIIIALDDLIKDYERNLNDEDFLIESGEENIEKVSDSLKASISELTNYKHHIKFITSNNNANFMPESTSKETSSIINIQKNNNGKEINEAIESAADRAMEDVFKNETGMEYEAAVREAKEKLKGTEDRIEEEINDDKKIIQNQAAGIEDEEIKEIIISDDKEAGQNLKDKTINSKNDAEIKIGEIEAAVPSKEPIQGEVKEIKDEKIEAVKKDFENKIKNIDGKIKILENSHGNPGDRRLYIAREAGIDIKQLTPKEEGRQRLIILARRKAEKAGLQKVEEIANNSEIKNYDELQNRLWDNFKSAKSEFSKKCDELDKEPKDSDRRKKLIEEKRDLQAKMQMARDSVADFDNHAAKEREEKDKKRQMRNQKAIKPRSKLSQEVDQPKTLEDLEREIIKWSQEIDSIRKGVAEAEAVGDKEKVSKLKKAIVWRERESRSNEEEAAKKSAKKGGAREPSKNPTELENDEAETGHKAHGSVYAKESTPEDALEDKVKQKAVKEVQTKKDEEQLEFNFNQKGEIINGTTKKSIKLKTALEIGLEKAASMGLEEKDSEKSQEPAKEVEDKKEEPVSAEAMAGKEKTAEEILREKNIEVYGGEEKLNQIFEDYKRLNELEDRGAHFKEHPLFSEWDALRVKLANVNLEVIGKDRTIDLYKIQNKDEMIREYFNTKLEEPLEAFQKDIEKSSPSVLAIRAATLIKYRNELKNCDWQDKDKYRDIPRKEYLETIKVLEQKIDILNGMLPKKEGATPESALKDLSIDDFKKIEKEPEYKGGYPAVIEGEKIKTEMTAEQTAKVERILKEFNLTAEDAEKVDGFKDLSYGQRLLALENLRQLTLRDVRIGSVKKQKEEAGQAQGFWKKLWTGIKKKYDIAKHEKSISQSLNKEDNLATLTQLTRGMKEFKTEVVEKNGKLEFQYVSGLENLTPEQAARVQKFNDVASELSKMPMEWTADDSKKGFFRQMMDKAGLGQSWSPDDPTRGQYNRCQELTAEFQSLKQEVLQVVKQQKDADFKKGGVEKFDDWETQSHAMAQMLQIENLLRCNRAMNVNPDAEKVLMEIKSAPLWRRALNNIATERGIYMAAGFAARSVTVTFLGTAGLVGAGAGMGGYMGYKRGKETLRENDALAQHKDFEETKKKRIEKFQRAKQGKIGPAGEMEKTEKKIEDANVLARNLNNFVEYIGKEDDPKRQMDLARRLRDRVKYVKTALDEGRINFGATDTRVASLYELTDKLNDAVNCSEMYHPSTRHEDQWKKEEAPEGMNLKEHKHLMTVEQRLDRYIKDSKIELNAERRKYLVKKMAVGALYGAGFVTAGMMVREVASHIDPHLFNAQGETDLGVRWISGGGSGKPLVGGIVGKYIHSEPGSGGGGPIPPHEAGMSAGGGSGKSAYEVFMDNKPKDYNAFPQDWPMKPVAQPEIPMGEGSFAERFLRAAGMHEGSPAKPDLQKIVAEYSEYFKGHPELLKNNNSSQEFLNHLKSDLQNAGLDSDAAKNITTEFNAEMGKIGTGFHPEGTPLPGAESTGGSGGGEHIAAAGGAGKAAAETLAGVKHEAVQFVNEIRNIGGIKHDSIWRSVNELVRDHAKEMGMEYPGKGGTKLSEVEWYNLKASQLVNEFDKSTPGGIKDLVYEGNKVVAEKGSGGNWRINIEQSSGFTPGRLADLHHHAAGAKAPDIENESSVPEFAPIHLEPIWEPMINEPQATDHPWDNWPKQAAGNRLNEIFDYPFGPQGAETTTYQYVKGDSAEAFLKRDFFKEIAGNHELDVSEKDALMHDVTKYRELQNYLNDMAKKPGNYPRTGETVDQFIHRLNRNIVMTPEHAVTDAAPGETAPVPEAQNKIEIDKIDEDFFKKKSAVEEVFKGPEVIAAAKPIHLSRDNFSADIQFKYNQSGEPISVDWIDAKIDGVRGSEYYEANYLKTIAKGFKEAGFALENDARENASKAGRHLMELIKIHDELIIRGEKQGAAVLLDQIKEEIGIINTRYGQEMINSEKLPQELREKLGK